MCWLKGALIFSVLLATAMGFGPLCKLNATMDKGSGRPVESAAGTKVAFLGDQGSSSSMTKVLQLAKNWGADPIVILGDFDYSSNPTLWNSMVNNALGTDSYPILAVGGNHDVSAWSGYSRNIQANMQNSGLSQYCTGTPGLDIRCNYKGVVFVLNQVGTQGSSSTYLSTARQYLTEHQSAPWKFCGWHKNQHLYQTGEKSDETGYEILDLCRTYGAVVSTAHEHSYSRTVLMSNFAKQTIVQPVQKSTLQLSLGESFLFVSGVGGKSLRPWIDGLNKNPWWATCAATDNGLQYGALLCEFQTDSAKCEQRDINGKVWDSFTILPPKTYSPVPEIDCRVPMLEVAAEQDLYEDRQGNTFLAGSTIDIMEHLSAFRFLGVSLGASDKLKSVHLQVYGITSEGASDITISLEYSPTSPLFSASRRSISTRRIISSSISWTKTDGSEDWEEGEVWVSPNLAPLLQEVLAQPDWVPGRSALTVILKATGGNGASRIILSRDYDDCVAPTLSIQKELECN